MKAGHYDLKSGHLGAKLASTVRSNISLILPRCVSAPGALRAAGFLFAARPPALPSVWPPLSFPGFTGGRYTERAEGNILTAAVSRLSTSGIHLPCYVRRG